MTLPNDLLGAIGRAVQDSGGTHTDIRGIVREWQQLDCHLDHSASQLLFDEAQGQEAEDR